MGLSPPWPLERIGLKLCGSASSADLFKHENNVFKMGRRGKGIMEIPVSYPGFHISYLLYFSRVFLRRKWLRRIAGVIFCDQSIICNLNEFKNELYSDNWPFITFYLTCYSPRNILGWIGCKELVALQGGAWSFHYFFHKHFSCYIEDSWIL